MNRMKRVIASSALAATLALAVPAAEARQGALRHAGDAGGKSFGQAALIALGAVTGAVVLIGGSIWYYVHHRHAEEQAEVPASPPAE